jgi:hypothetical protein
VTLIHRVFLLSPAHCGGERAQVLLGAGAAFPLARQLRSAEGAPLGDVFAFLSGLYFRGKLAYARAFAKPPAAAGGGVLVITAHAGLQPADRRVTAETLRAAARVDIRADNPRYRRPLVASARALAAAMGAASEVVLLGSVASGKYVDVLLDVFGERLSFPATFVGRGDMSRGGLMLRCVAEGRELDYVPVAGALRHGPRPPRLERPSPAPRGITAVR